MNLTVYSFQDADGNEPGTFTTQNYEEAKAHARAYGYRVFGNEYEFSESVPLDDFTATPTEIAWRDRWEELEAEYAFIALAINWHGGQSLAFYKLQCNGKILDAEHARDVYLEARRALKGIEGQRRLRRPGVAPRHRRRVPDE